MPTPSQSWKSGDAITAARLEEMRRTAITEVRVGPGLSVQRVGNAVVISRTPDPRAMLTVSVRVKDNATGNEAYFGYVLLPPTTKPTENSNSSDAVSGSEPPGDYDALIFNRQGNGQATHSITDTTDGPQIVNDFIAHTYGEHTSDGKLICYINGDDWESCG
jgi:hypothetical protein